jgi:hypothetical protein
MPVNGLTREARQILGEMELLMHGKTASLNSSGRGGERNPVPQGEASPPVDYWLGRFRTAALEEVAGLVQAARHELERIKRRDTTVVVQEETREEWEARLLRDGEGFEARDVAVKFNCAVQDVTRLRRRAGLDPNLGEAFRPVDAPLEEKKERVLEMRRAGVSTRQIAQAVGVHQTQVVRWVRSASVHRPA